MRTRAGVLLLAVCLVLGAASQAHASTPLDLGGLIPNALNNSREIVGDTLDQTGGDAPGHAAVWKTGVLTVLDEPLGTTASDAYAVNASGLIVGDSREGSQIHALFWHDPADFASRIGPLPSDLHPNDDFSQAVGVTTAGEIVGETIDQAVLGVFGFLRKPDGLLTRVGDADRDDGTVTVAGITPDGKHILGRVGTIAHGGAADGWYLWPSADASGVKLDVTPAVGPSAGLGAAQVVQYSGDLASDGTLLGYKGEPIATRQYYLRLPSGTEVPVNGLAGLNAVNAKHTVVGLILGDDGMGHQIPRAAMWKPDGTVVDLNTLLPPGSGFSLYDALAINDNGDIVGLAAHDGKEVGFLLPGDADGTVAGEVTDHDGAKVAGAKVQITGKTDAGDPVSVSVLTDAQGHYFTRLDGGTYTVAPTGDPPDQNGGTWSTKRCDGTFGDGSCTLNVATGREIGADFTYTACAATDRHPNGKPPTGCPIIFIPGFLGSRIVCGAKELWPNIPGLPNFGEMRLETDGKTNVTGPCNSDAVAPSGEGGIVRTAGIDIYGGALDFLHHISPEHAEGFAYDWRRSPEDAVAYLDKWIDAVLKQSGSSRVVLMAHSMGGLVTRAYLADPGRAAKVSRAITLGTPYWGAPKSHFALLTAHTDAAGFVGLDYLVNARDLQTFARTAQGLYWLYPSAKYGPWLTIRDGRGIPTHPLAAAAIGPWITSLGGAAPLIYNAAAGHARLDDAPLNGVDYETVVGAGTSTVTAIRVNLNVFGVGPVATLSYGSGDGTVPELSATQGASGGHDPGVPVHYVCRVGHVDLPGNPAVQERIKAFLLKGTPVTGPEEDCPMMGVETAGYALPIHSDAAGSAAATGGALSIAAAADKGLAQVFTMGAQTIVTTDAARPVTLRMAGRNLAFSTTPISGKGRGTRHDYGPVSGTIIITPAGSVTRNGKPLKPGRTDHTPPRTTARVTRAGKRFVVRLAAHDASGVRAIWTRIGKAAPALYRKPLKLAAKQVRALRFFSVDVFGLAEPARAVKRRS